ncbi:DUF1353 domain-containing protein [Planktotalea sp.]|uniref:DUF1353 domain-containing protein n=1 Tax=Planktotalea sp. TaxID=2029877 RepID=UPI003D6A820B
MPDVSWCCKGGARGYVTVRTVYWSLMWKGSPFLLTILPGREFESSVPCVLQWLWSPDDPFYLKAALIHDVLLESGSRTFEADGQWRAAAISEKAPPFKTGIAYAGMILRRYWQWLT